MQSPPLRLQGLLADLPCAAGLSPDGQRLLTAALEATITNESADAVAVRLGLRNRHQLNRLLHRHGLPTYRVIAAVSRLASLLESARLAGRTLGSEMHAGGVDPAWAYRAVRRLAGQPWSALRHLSTPEFVSEVLAARMAAIGREPNGHTS